MDKPIRYESIQEPLDEEERALMDPDAWDWGNPVEAVVAENLLVELPIEVTLDEHRILGRAARDEGLGTHEFSKQVALNAAREKDTERVAGAVNPRTREWRSG